MLKNRNEDSIPMTKVIESMQTCATKNGADLTNVISLLPINIGHNAKSDFSRGVVAGIAHAYHMLCQTPEGRQAAFDLGFQPLLQDVKSP